jgi:hyperosmotically inducible periplasmic protein
MNSSKTLRPLAAGAALLLAGSLTAAAQGTAGATQRHHDRDQAQHQSQPGMHQARSAEEAARQAGGQAASKILGSALQDARGERIGEVEDLVVDLQSGRVIGVVVATGGTLGMGQTHSVISPGELRRAADGDAFVTDLSRARLGEPREDEPLVGTGRDRERRDHDRAERERRDRGVERTGPVLPEPRAGAPRAGSPAVHGADGAHDADNTGLNRRDRGHDTVLPLNQGNNRADIEVTARIRSAIVGNDYLSTNAKNVKIITRDGQVTLRGPVNSEEERRIISDLASEAAPGRVDNQLEVTRR